MIRMAASRVQKDSLSSLKTLLANAAAFCVVIFCSTHPGEWWKVLLDATPCSGIWSLK
jgi:hypothetical protein